MIFQKNLGYGAAIKTGLKIAISGSFKQMEMNTDVRDLIKLVKFTKTADLVITYRFEKI